MRLLGIVLLSLWCLMPAFAPQAAECPAPDLPAPLGVATPLGDSLTAAEARVREIVQREGVHVVHFWAPWCGNSVAELRAGWYELVEANPGVSFTFVTVWNDGASGRATMAQYGLPERVLELPLADFGPSADLGQRRRHFLGQPLVWIPTTWIFRNRGELAFALNYGEMPMPVLQALIDAAHAAWEH